MAADGATILKKMYTIQKNRVWVQSAWISCDSRGLMMCFPQGRALLSRLQGLKAKGIQLKISSGMIDSTELDTLAKHSQLLLSLCSTFCVLVFKHAATYSTCPFSLLAVLSPSLSGSVHLSLSFHLSYHLSVCFIWSGFSLQPNLPLPYLFLFFLIPFVFYSISVSLSLPISRRWGPLCEHDSADQRPPPLLLLGGRQETFLHRQRQHGLEIPGHCIQDIHSTHKNTHTPSHTSDIWGNATLVLYILKQHCSKNVLSNRFTWDLIT